MYSINYSLSIKRSKNAKIKRRKRRRGGEERSH